MKTVFSRYFKSIIVISMLLLVLVSCGEEKSKGLDDLDSISETSQIYIKDIVDRGLKENIPELVKYPPLDPASPAFNYTDDFMKIIEEVDKEKKKISSSFINAIKEHLKSTEFTPVKDSDEGLLYLHIQDKSQKSNLYLYEDNKLKFSNEEKTEIYSMPEENSKIIANWVNCYKELMKSYFKYLGYYFEENGEVE